MLSTQLLTGEPLLPERLSATHLLTGTGFAQELPLALSAIVSYSPAVMAVTLLRPSGILVCPKPLYPHAVTVPFANKARLWPYPAATPTTLVKPAGTLVCPKILYPQAVTVPLAVSARL